MGINEIRRMIPVALDNAQAAKGAITKLLADMTALKRGPSPPPYRKATDSYRDTFRNNWAASSGGPVRMRPTNIQSLIPSRGHGDEPRGSVRDEATTRTGDSGPSEDIVNVDNESSSPEGRDGEI